MKTQNYDWNKWLPPYKLKESQNPERIVGAIYAQRHTSEYAHVWRTYSDRDFVLASTIEHEVGCFIDVAYRNSVVVQYPSQVQPTPPEDLFGVWPPRDGDYYLCPSYDGKIRFTGHEYRPASGDFEFFTQLGKRDGYGPAAWAAGALQFVQYNPVNWKLWIPPGELPDPGYSENKIFKPGQVWAVRFGNTFPRVRALVWRVKSIYSKRSVSAYNLASIGCSSEPECDISNPMYLDPAILVAEAGQDPVDPDLLYQFLYK